MLLEFKGNDVRPTHDKVRESLFNILRDKVPSCNFLDLFSGTGAMGIEAISRGAKRVVFNDISRDSVSLIKKNLNLLKVDNGFQVYNLDAITFLKNTSEKFDVIYIDPPYKMTELGLNAIKKAVNVIDDDGIIVMEEEFFMEEVEGLKIVDTRKYGRAHLTFYKKG